ncbi:hypothetical protein SETIT_7G261000v2 [Setaria italica]|uniref:ABC transporter domain-containing protein n=1 Tax=Setaria italica TaxID=4555 RepID=A0A368RZX5_SETIT|nr:hypothetical protein SETIT_7G261000v2 [Setaria italica]
MPTDRTTRSLAAGKTAPPGAKSRPLKTLQPSSYLAGIDLPPSDDEEVDQVEERAPKARASRAAVDVNTAARSLREVKKDERRKLEAAARAETAARDAAAALWDNPDAYVVTIGGRVLRAGDDAAAAAFTANARDVVVEDFDVSVPGAVTLFEGASLRVSHGRRYGLVGPNGKGKSTLLKLLNWRKLPCRATLLEASGDAAGNGWLCEVYNELTLRGWASARARTSKILAGLGFDQAKQARPTSTFSGGWIKRIALAGALFVQPALLLLDEPTNHLDLQAVLWLEEYLSAQCKSTLIVVFHELPQRRLPQRRGNFDAFVRSYEQKKATAMKEHEKLAKAARKGFSYEDFKLSGVDADIAMGQRVAVVGPNGSGKSTFLKLLAGELVPTEGEARRSHKLRIGLYSQHFCDSLPKDRSAVQYLLEKHPHLQSKPGEARAMLGKFGLPKENHLTLIDKLSGGQKARVVLASIALGEPHVLLLDEPTNNLDMQSIDALADALDEFAGGVVIISHDSRLITRLCADENRSEVWVVQDGMVRPYGGSFAEYRDDLLEDIRKEMAMD